MAQLSNLRSAQTVLRMVATREITVSQITEQVMLAGRTFICNYNDLLAEAEETARLSAFSEVENRFPFLSSGRMTRIPDRYNPSGWVLGSGAAILPNRDGTEIPERDYSLSFPLS